MDAFMMWFWRPLAEFLGGLLVFVLLFLVLLAYELFKGWKRSRRNK